MRRMVRAFAIGLCAGAVVGLLVLVFHITNPRLIHLMFGGVIGATVVLIVGTGKR